MTSIGDPTMRAIEYALDGLSLRSQVTADNIANARVPGFRPQKVSFEDSLSRAMGSGRFDGLRRADAQDAGAQVNPDGYAVNIEDEVVEMMKTSLTQDAMIEAYNFKIGLIQAAVWGR